MSYFNRQTDATAGYVPGFQPQETEVVKLNTNENPYPPSPRVLDAIRGLDAEALRRYPDPLGRGLQTEAGRQHNVDPSWILCCNGGDDLLSIAIRAICDRDRALAYPVPTYSLYPVLARLHGCPIHEIPFNADFTLPTALRQTGAALTIVCNPNAPSGSCLTPAELGALAADLPGVLLIDEAYVDYAESDCLDLVRVHPNVLVLRSLSKGYSLAGIRCGYGIGQPELLAGLLKVKDSYNVNTLTQIAARAALADQAYAQERIATIKAERRRLTEALRALGLTVGDSQANFVLATVPGGRARDLHEQLAARHIYVRYFALPGLEDKLRISIGTPDQNDRLTAALQELLA